jgi:hypothetical protein
VAAEALRSHEPVRENRIRRVVQRRGYLLQKSRRRDPDAFDFAAFPA